MDYIHVTLQMALSSEQVRALLGAARGTRFEALYVVAVHTGLRQGELLGLRWTDVDLDAASPRLSVRRSLEITDGLNFGPPKNKASRRSVPLNRTTVAALQAHRTSQNEERLRLGDLWQNTTSYFPIASASRSTTTISTTASTSPSYRKPDSERRASPSIA